MAATTPPRASPAASVDAVAEFRVVDTMYSAEYGQSIGSVINFITKSGTNQVHGSVFEYFRKRSSGCSYLVQQRSSYRRSGEKAPLPPNQFGGSIGGPIIKDKLFFFGDYEGVRQRTGVYQPFQVPTQAFRDTLSGEQLDLVNTLPLPKYKSGRSSGLPTPSDGSAGLRATLPIS